ncbi:Phosphatidylinositol transfer protein [Tritrichomonas foetus]|uniref:Phosphatidylinositol transfer protein n=1 Tax=Tritrichomonas foetus TaxID=1144522 RepID=A0A1J4J7L0_9EUKA|nr:Phosphatidylinositol transfer protein [Tritrichomonas foetus]|eukprot:OHS94199.1 Phosphatidylinositol transfer protein [Tritrichomonas foetus]
MRIIEFRIFMPFKIPWCRAAAKYSVNRRTREETKGGDGFEIVDAGNFEEDGVTGRYVHRIFHFKNQVPEAVRWTVPDTFAHIHEHNRNAFPHYVAKFEIPGMEGKLILDTETKHVEYTGEDNIPDNIMGFTPEELTKREVVYPDILNGKTSKSGQFSLHGFKYEPGGIPELKCNKKKQFYHHVPEWVKMYPEGAPLCLIIKTVKFRFKWPGVQNVVERIVTNSVFPDVYLDTHRAMVYWIDEWFNMTDEDLMDMEQQTKEKLSESHFDT